MFAMMSAQFTTAAGWGEYFPRTVPARYVQGGTIAMVSYGIVILTRISGLLDTLFGNGQTQGTDFKSSQERDGNSLLPESIFLLRPARCLCGADRDMKFRPHFKKCSNADHFEKRP